MFTGIIEAHGKVIAIRQEGSNKRFTIQCPFTSELRIDQSVAHDGVCMTVVDIRRDEYDVVAIDETLKRTNLNDVKPTHRFNLERCTKLGDRLDGHIVQGHVDTVALLENVEDAGGSSVFKFKISNQKSGLIVEKGSIGVNGVSLTIVHAGSDSFSVAIIPYTMEHTNFSSLQKGDKVNIEFDIIGKYVARMLEEKNS